MSASLAKIAVWGVSYRTAPIEVREQLAISETQLPETLQMLRSADSAPEVVCLSTCNRTEIYTVTDKVHDAEARARELFQAHFPMLRWQEHVYHRADEEAVRHVFRVASSLDSMVLGEPQILGQVKRAYELAHAQGTAGTLLGRCFTSALGVGKKVRQRTELGRGHVSVSAIAVELVQRVFGDLATLEVGLVGAGDMAEAALESLKAYAGRWKVTNRTLSNAEQLAERFQSLTVVPWSERDGLMQGVDILIMSTSSQEPLLTNKDAKRILRKRRYKPWCVLDLGLPRNVAPDVANIDGVFVYNVDDLQQIALENQAQRAEAAKAAEAIVETETEAFMQWWHALSVTESVKKFRQHTEALVKAVLDTHPSAKTLGEAEREHLAQSIASKWLHQPLTSLKQSASELDAEALAVALERLFFRGPQ